MKGFLWNNANPVSFVSFNTGYPVLPVVRSYGSIDLCLIAQKNRRLLPQKPGNTGLGKTME